MSAHVAAGAVGSDVCGAPTPTPTRVLFVTYGLAAAGPERRIVRLARHFPTDIDVHVCVIGDDLTLLDEIRMTRAHVFRVRIDRPYLQWRQVRRILTYIQEHRIQVINSFDLKTLIIGAWAKLRYGSRVTLVHHLICVWDDFPWHQRLALRAALRLTDHVVCNGRMVRAHVLGSDADAAVSVIPNGVDCEYFNADPRLRAAARGRLGFGDGHFVVGTISNVRPVKNYPFLLNAMKRMVASYPHARLLCVGGGPQLEEMKVMARTLGLADHVLFTGLATGVRPFLSAMDAFALCSSNEGNPNVVLEAMAMSVPVVSASVGEVPHLIEHAVSGLLFASGDQAAFLAGLERLADDERCRLEMGAAGRRRAAWMYSSSQMVASYAALMRQPIA